jgi:Tol biopolymer transport system component
MPSPDSWGQVTFFDHLVAGEAANVLAGSKWGGNPGTTGITISYSFPDSNSAAVWSTDPWTGYGSPGDPGQETWDPGFAIFNEAERDAGRAAIQAFADVCDIVLLEIAETSTAVGELRFAYTGTATPDVFAYAYLPDEAAYAGDIWLNAAHRSGYFADLQPGSVGFATLMHEIGHALGLKHPFDGYPTLPESADHIGNTVMSYSVKPGLFDDGDSASIYPTTLMRYDILAVQYLYGQNLIYRGGDDTYVYQEGQAYWQTLWDTGGTDTIVYESSSDGAVIDLNSGVWSELGAPIAFDDGTEDARTVFVFDQVVLENARGGGGADRITGTGQANELQGRGGDDTLAGGSGNDTLDGGPGADSMDGSWGADVFIVDDPNDRVFDLLTTDEIDTIYASASYGMSLDHGYVVDNLVLTGTADLWATGNGITNVITGNPGNNVLSGGGANVSGAGVLHDTLLGGAGNDTYQSYAAQDQYGYAIVPHDVIVENPGEGIDEVRSLISYTLGAELEILRLQGTSDVDASGNELANLILGNGGDNRLDGAAGADTLRGGAGDDGYVVDAEGDVVAEALDRGIDSVGASVDFALPRNVEDLTLAGDAGIDGNGNALGNRLTGNSAANVLRGLQGNDTLDGSAGADLMAGGFGDDVYVAGDAGDAVVERAGAGYDQVRASASHTLDREVESLLLTGVQDIDGSGNGLDNRLDGNLADNRLDGRAGADTMNGRGGDDIYLVDDVADVVDERMGVSVTDFAGGGRISSVSADGRYVAFRGQGSDFGLEDATIPYDIVVKDLYTGAVSLASTNADGSQLPYPSNTPAISDDGRYVAFWSNAGIYVKDLQTGELRLASSTAAGEPVNAEQPTISPDGRYVAFTSYADNLGGGHPDLADLFVKDLQSGAVSWVASTSPLVAADFSADGRFIAFEGFDSAGSDGNGLPDVFVKDLQTGAVTLVSSAGVPADGRSVDPAISGDGRYVVFASYATNLVADDDNGQADLFMKDLQTGLVTRVSAAADGTEANSYSSGASISSDGRYVAFTSPASNLVAADENSTHDIFIKDLHTGAITRIDALDLSALPGLGRVEISGDGRFLFTGVEAPNGDLLGRVVTNADADAGGADAVLSRVDYVLPAHVERLALTGSGAIDGTGNDADNALRGNDAANVLTGGAGDDTLNGFGGADVLFGGPGNDVLKYDAADLASAGARLNGGPGADTVRISGAGVALDLTMIADGRITGIELIALAGSGDNTLVLGIADVLALSGSSDRLQVLADAGDEVEAHGAWTQDSDLTIGAQLYHRYSAGGASLLVDADASVVIV